jgi:hypothetical protein
MPLSTATAAVALALAAAGGTASMLGEAGADACSAGSSGAIFDDDTGEALNECAVQLSPMMTHGLCFLSTLVTFCFGARRCAVQLVKRATGTVDTGGAARSSGGGAAARAEGLGGGVGRQPPSVVEIDEGTWKYVSIDLSRNGGGGAADRTRVRMPRSSCLDCLPARRL